SWALKFGMTIIPLMVKPSEEVGVGEKVMVRTYFVAAEEEQKEEANQQSVFSENSAHVGTLFERN
ncbi:hypothetical protein KI387_026799, partial [Taxus chinensis]